MADTWTYAAGVWTLTLDGSGSGQESRHKDITGLTAATQYTFYSTVNANDLGVGAFIEVDGGDRTTVATTGSHLQFVRGITNGSGGIRLRRGVADAGGSSASASGDTLQYASSAAATLAGWTVTDTDAEWSWLFNTGHAIAGSGLSSSIAGFRSPGLGGAGASTINMERTFNVGAGTTVIGKMWCEGVGSRWAAVALKIRNTAGTVRSAGLTDGNDGVEHQATSSLTAGGDGLITVAISLEAANINYPSANSFYFSGLELEGAGGTSNVTWTDWDYCIGTGVPQDPIGGDPEDPPPVDPHLPPPVVGVRPFGVYDIPTGGYGYWNSTVKELGPNFGANTINETTSHEMFNIFRFGGTDDWGGTNFTYERWKAAVDAVADDAIIRPLLDAAVTAGWAYACLVIDEPYHPTRYGGPIPIATVERMCLYIKSLWPTWPTVLRVAPTFDSWLTRKIIGCNWLWAEYLTKRGDVTAFRDDNIARTAALGFDGVIMGLHYSQFHGVGTGDITPAEIDHYGTVLASSDSPLVVAFHGWKYFNSWYEVAGAAAAVGRLQATFASHDP